MTVIDAEQRPASPAIGHRPARSPYGRRRPAPTRPAGAATAFRGTGVAISRAPHRRRPVSAAVTIAVAGMAALITVWLGALAHSGGVAGTAPAVPDRLAVVRVQSGENLQRLAARVSPDAPVTQVVQRIRELNQLDSAALDAGQTLLAPVG
ncbi:MAG: LysM peptidoglycan-binding domain-containing protein [Mycobacteriaceae bacterium]|nr:LysM peptidoglycan-binding domain-containing protein [Mycobacteriaceae bacterium]MBV9640723.1 LysM peptidoglycan-binding domain-containing protein [Mycobacteriaceae bacterium]